MAGFSLRDWWRLDERDERESADNPLAPITADQRRAGSPLIALAFGWGFLITGLLAGGALGAGVPLWPDLLWYSVVGNSITFAIGALVGYIAYRTGCNSALIFRSVYGAAGAYVPVLMVALLTIGWQGIVVGASAQVWTQSPGTAIYYAAAIFAGLLYTGTTLFGVKGLEKVGVPSMVVLVGVGLYAIWMNVDKAGGLAAVQALSEQRAAQAPLTGLQAINIVVGSWIVGAVVMAEYVRFSRSFAVAMAIPFVVLFVDQVFLHLVGALGAIVSGNADFTAYMMSLSGLTAFFGIVGMTLALWTTGDTNLYLPSVQTAALFRRPKRVTVVICGLLGTILGLGIYEHFLGWIDLLATIVPPIIGPVIAEYYLFRGRPSELPVDEDAPLNVSAILALVGGAVLAAVGSRAGAEFAVPVAPALVGLVASVLIYTIARTFEVKLRRRAPAAA
jgi:cytosine permease